VNTSRASLFGLVALIMAVSAAGQWWSNRHQDALGAEVAALAAPGDVFMVSSDTCAPCTRARTWLKRNEVAFAECSLERDRGCAERWQAAGAPGTPLLFVRGQPQLGFSAERLRAALQRDG
jgi:glutaredoxin